MAAFEVNGTVVAKGKAVRRAWRTRPCLQAEDILSREGEGPFVDLVDENALPLGTGLLEDGDAPALRLISSARTSDPIALLRTRLERAEARRRTDLLGADAYRLCHGEADGVPGLKIDRFGQGLLITPESEVTARLVEPLLSPLLEITGAKCAVLCRALAGRDPELEVLAGDDTTARFHHGRLVVEVDLRATPHLAALTGQLENQRYVRRWAKGRVLDAYAGFGGYGLQLADAGAREVVFLEPRPAAAEALERDAARNALDGRVRVVRADPAEQLRAFAEAGERFDVAVVHPDRRVEGPDGAEKATRRAFEIHRRVLRLLDEGGVLITWSPSTALNDVAFEETLADAATRCRKHLQVLARMGAGPDYPRLLGAREEAAADTLVARVLSIA